MIPEMRSWTREEMMQRVAFFKDLKGSKTGLPDSELPECERELINVIGFQPPKEEGGIVSPVGATAARLAAIPISEGFNVGPCDVVSFPPGVARRFFNVTEGEPDVEHLIMFVIAGNGPQAEFTPDANGIMARGGDGLMPAAA